MTPELAADKAASVLYLAEKAVNSDHELEKAAMQAAMLAGIAAVWVQLHTSLVNALKTAEPQPAPVAVNVSDMAVKDPDMEKIADQAMRLIERYRIEGTQL